MAHVPCSTTRAWRGWSLAPKSPPVSNRSKAVPRHSAGRASASRVVPGMGETIAGRLPVIRLNRVDFPTFGRPTSTTEGNLRGMVVSQLSLWLDSVSVTIYAVYRPAGDPKHDQGRHRQRSIENR